MPEHSKASYWIQMLEMQAHPEGGYFKEVYRSDLEIDVEQGSRPAATSIYYLLRAGEFSAFHRIKSDETWYFHAGGPIEIVVIDEWGNLTKQLVGLELEKGMFPQFTVNAGRWFASHPKGEFSLVGCSVAPGFDFRDFEMADRQQLLKDYPQLENEILAFTRA